MLSQVQSEPLITFSSNPDLQSMIRNEFGPVIARHVVGFVFLWRMMSEDASTRCGSEGTIGNLGG